jgi:hypothetical protein
MPPMTSQVSVPTYLRMEYGVLQYVQVKPQFHLLMTSLLFGYVLQKMHMKLFLGNDSTVTHLLQSVGTGEPRPTLT